MSICYCYVFSIYYYYYVLTVELYCFFFKCYSKITRRAIAVVNGSLLFRGISWESYLSYI